MFKNLRMKLATRRVAGSQSPMSRGTKKSGTPKSKIRRAIEWLIRPVRAMGRIICDIATRIWLWLRRIDLIAMVNLTLLVAIIVLFSMLIMDIMRGRHQPVVMIDTTPMVTTTPANPVRPMVTVTDAAAPRMVRARSTARHNNVLVLRTTSDATQTPTTPVMAKTYNLFGDIVIDTHYTQTPLTTGTRILGNIYLQNMRRFTLPCGVYIDGNLFLRDVQQLNFCGDFVVTGNIYLNRNSSFGPIPSTARLGGQVIF